MKLIDTSAWIHALRPGGDQGVTGRVRALLEAGEAAWCPMIRVELWNGAQGEHEKRVLREMGRQLIELPISQEVWKHAVELACDARSKGKAVPTTDILIAACAICHGVPIEHTDEHFGLIATL